MQCCVKTQPPKQNTIAILFSRWPPAYSMMGAAILDLCLRLHICGFCIFSRFVTVILAVLEDFEIVRSSFQKLYQL